MYNKRLPDVPPQPFTANGTSNGRVIIARPWVFKTGQIALLTSTTQPILQVQIKRIEETRLFVGPVDHNVESRSDISAYLVSESAAIYAVEQLRPMLIKDQSYSVIDLEHEEEPTVARRVLIVDPAGRPIDSTLADGQRALAVSATLTTVGPLTVNQGTGGASPWLIVMQRPAVDVISESYSVGSGSPTNLIPTVHTFRSTVTVQNLSTVPVFIGGTTVSSTTGFRILPNGSYTCELGPSSTLYAIADSGIADVRILRIRALGPG